jgi:diguanylate cyclase (GGDEF)-like protein
MPVEQAARKPVAGVRESSIFEVVRCCWAIYQKAADAYCVLAGNSTSEELSRLWRGMAEGLNKHILYWKRISELVQGDPSLEVLGNPHEVVQQLRHLETRVERIQESCTALYSVMDYFYLAYSLEVQLIHPVLCSLPQSVLSIPDREVVKWDYATNLRDFLLGMQKHCENHYLPVALVDSLERMWHQNVSLAEQDSLDPVTGVYNRRMLLRIISSSASMAERDGHNVAIIMVGLENMHELYTTFDLRTADEVVKRFYHAIKPGIRVSDTVGRYNFSTFLIYLSRVNHQFLYEIAQRFADSANSIVKAGFVLSVHIGGAYGQIRAQADHQLEYYVRRSWDCLMRAKFSRTQRIVIE